MYMINLHPLLSLQVRCYPEPTAEDHDIKARQPRGGREATNGSCSTVLFFTLWSNFHAFGPKTPRSTNYNVKAKAKDSRPSHSLEDCQVWLQGPQYVEVR